ncbi:MAG: hypothetical protein WD294_07940 [Phycisphaeraceae bacterium]
MEKSGRPPEATPTPPPTVSLCAEHPEAVAHWRCDACDAWRCDDCVHIYPAKEGTLASCRVCKGICVDPEHLPRTGSRAGGIEESGERRQRHLRDTIMPIVVLGGVGFLLVATGLAVGGLTTVIGFISLVAVSGGAIFIAMLGLEKFGGLDFGDQVRRQILKAGAIAATLLLVRLTMGSVTGLSAPEGGGYLEAFASVFRALLAAIFALLLAPVLTLWVTVSYFFKLELSETIEAVVFIFLIETAVLVMVLMS